LIGVHVPKELRGSGAGTEITKDSRRRNLKIPGHKPLVGYAIKQTPEEGSYLDRFYTTGERGRRTQTYKYDPALADPERIKRGYVPSDVGRYQHSRIEPKEPMPTDWQNVGGPRSKLVRFGGAQIPGGLEGTFTFNDLVWLKANPFPLDNLTDLQQNQLYRKHALTMTRDLDDPLERYNTLLFGQRTGNTGFEDSQMLLPGMRARSQADIERLAAYIPEGKTWKDLTTTTYLKGPDGKPLKDAEGKKIIDVIGERKEISDRMIGDYNLQAREQGGLGIAGTSDFSASAELARLHLENPEFHKQQLGQSDKEYIEFLMNRIPGLSQKTASLSQLLLKPMTSEYGGLDLHMNRYLGLNPKEILSTQKVAPSLGHPTHLTRPNVPQHIKNILPENLKSATGEVQMMSPEYERGTAMLNFLSGTKPFGTGMTQWQIYDKVRGNRFNPHEQLYPGIHHFPRMPDRRLEFVRAKEAEAGHFRTSSQEPNKPISPWHDAMYYGLLPLSKILNTFKPREPYQQMPVGSGLSTMQYGPGS